jgi:hypothetical protein
MTFASDQPHPDRSCRRGVAFVDRAVGILTSDPTKKLVGDPWDNLWTEGRQLGDAPRMNRTNRDFKQILPHPSTAPCRSVPRSANTEKPGSTSITIGIPHLPHALLISTREIKIILRSDSVGTHSHRREARPGYPSAAPVVPIPAPCGTYLA